MKCRRAEISFEAILAAAFITILMLTFFAVYQFYSGPAFTTSGDSEMADEYYSFLSQMRSHMRYATEFEVGHDYVMLKSDTESTEKTLATYRLFDSKIVCFDPDDNGQTIISGIQKAVFNSHPRVNGLLMVSIFPEDKMFIPFFTSFALRGTSDANQ